MQEMQNCGEARAASGLKDGQSQRATTLTLPRGTYQPITAMSHTIHPPFPNVESPKAFIEFKHIPTYMCLSGVKYGPLKSLVGYGI